MLKELEHISLDKSSPLPLYHQLKESLKHSIIHLPADTALPSEPELALHFGISRPTVRQAISTLATEGYVYKIQGKGTFVAHRKLKRDFGDWHGSLNEEIQHRGLTPTTAVTELREIVCDELISKKFDIECNTPLFLLKRIRAVDGKAILLLHSYLIAKLVPGLMDKTITNRSLHELLQSEYNLTIKKTRRTLEAVAADTHQAKLLKVSVGTPLQYFRNTVILDTNEIIEYSEGWYRGDAVSFTFEYEKRIH